MVGIELPGEERVRPGPKRDLVVALHELYRGAGRPGLRKIAKAITEGDYRDTVSHEAVSDMLNGKTARRWSKLDCVVRQLAVWNAMRLDPDAVAARFLRLWEAATGDVPVPQPTSDGPGGADSPAASVGAENQEALPPVSQQGIFVPGSSGYSPPGHDSLMNTGVVHEESGWAQSRRGLITGRPRWGEPPDDRQTFMVRQLRDNYLSHPAFMARSSRSDGPPAVRVGIRMTCAPLRSVEPTSSAVRGRFLSFLSRQAVSGLVGDLAGIGGDEKWQKWGGQGRSNHEAILTGPDQQGAPAAWARLLLPEPRMTPGWSDSESALLLLHIERRPEDVPSPIPFLEWHRIFRKVLECPTALAGFLIDDLGLDIPLPEAVDDPELLDPPLRLASVATWLITPQVMTDLVDVSGYQQLPGSPVSAQFDAYAVTDADVDGIDAGDMASNWMRQMYDYALHLDEYDAS